MVEGDLPRASSEPDLNQLAALFPDDLPDIHLEMDLPPAPDDESTARRMPPPTAPPVLSHVGAVSFADYVATELARSEAPPLPPTPTMRPPHLSGVTDLARFLAPDVPGPPPRSPRSPRVTIQPSTSAALSGLLDLDIERARKFDGVERANTFDGAVNDGASSTGADDERGSLAGEPSQVISYSPHAHRQHQNKLSCLQVDITGKVELRSMSRTDILRESRETLRPSHPSPADAAQWIRVLDKRDAGQPPEMQTFASLVDGGDSLDDGEFENTSTARRKRRASREKLRSYLRNYLRNSLQIRDIRQVDPAFAAKPALWVRHTALVFSMERLRAIIFRSKVLLFEPEEPRTQLAADMTCKLIAQRAHSSVPVPFEQRALEALLIQVVGVLENDFMSLKPEVHERLTELPNELTTKKLDATTKKLENLRSLKQRLSRLRSRAAVVQEILEKVLDEDEDMANMYLTEKHASRDGARNTGDHDEVEMLLEAYLQSVDEIVNQTTLSSEQIDDTEDLVMIHLDTMRNRLLSVELALSVVSMTFGVGSMVSGIFGMNLPIALFDTGASPLWFAGVSGAILVTIVGVSWLVLTMLKKRGLYSVH